MNRRVSLWAALLVVLVLVAFTLGALRADKDRVGLTLGGLFKPTACTVTSGDSTLAVVAHGRGAPIVCGRLAKLAHEALDGRWTVRDNKKVESSTPLAVDCSMSAHGVDLQVLDKADSVYGQITCVSLRGQGWSPSDKKS